MLKAANVVSIDRTMRIILGIILIAAPYFVSTSLWANPLAKWGVPLIGIVFVVTAAVQFCPLYRVIGASTRKFA